MSKGAIHKVRTQPGGGRCLQNACNWVQGEGGLYPMSAHGKVIKKVGKFIKNDKFLKGLNKTIGTNSKEENYES